MAKPSEGAGDELGPWPVVSEAEDLSAAVGDEQASRAEQAEPQAARLPAPGLAVQCKHRHPGHQAECDLDNLQPAPVLRDVVQGQVPQAGRAGSPDAVLDLCPQAVAEFEFGDGLAGARGRKSASRSGSWPGRRPRTWAGR